MTEPVPSPGRSSRYVGMNKLDKYDVLEQLGQGTFGVVLKARQKSTGKLVALKKLIIHDSKDGFPITAFREITIMKQFRHLNVLQLIDMIHENSEDSKTPGFFYTVTPYISSDLNGLLNNPRVRLTIPQIKCIMKQIFQGINYIHNQNYLHRDIKTANILLDWFGVVKIADFGLARVYHGPPPKDASSGAGGGLVEYTGLVVTRWYRPPELLLGERKYTTAVDMWGIGCVLGEMFKKKPILEGKSDLDQADMIFRLLGSPTPEVFPNAELINRNGVNLHVEYQRTLESEYGAIMTPACLRLLSGLLTMDPRKRFNAARALESDFFRIEPVACLPEELPKFEESHEQDIKRFKEEKKRVNENVGSISMSRPPNKSLDHSNYGADHETPRKRRDFSHENRWRGEKRPWGAPRDWRDQSYRGGHQDGYNGYRDRGYHDGYRDRGYQDHRQGPHRDHWNGNQNYKRFSGERNNASLYASTEKTSLSAVKDYLIDKKKEEGGDRPDKTDPAASEQRAGANYWEPVVFLLDEVFKVHSINTGHEEQSAETEQTDVETQTEQHELVSVGVQDDVDDFLGGFNVRDGVFHRLDNCVAMQRVRFQQQLDLLVVGGDPRGTLLFVGQVQRDKIVVVRQGLVDQVSDQCSFLLELL
ncbi:hypothetical protein OGAPHI_003004 [Ogataea philodendri]|uniref:Serine/threonine-protein kinase BUR1 n=1 Tax=Ogataea philodendri TaxID=1378263 RepID=A0A9P8T6Q8_9ASCO|nr:uncharacterized protein OGAPHI_003004 [Ogataea philodendri]KAH3667355.1 hypothetical protein OGAPHI_003004 [Ogataea philodendri]